MAHAYTPGLRVTRRATIRKRRQLPLQGEVLAEVGDLVDREQVVARAELPGDVATVNLVNRLGVSPAELPGYMLKQVGDAVQEGEPIAETRPFIKWFRTSVPSPVVGTVESISSVTGQVLLRKQPRPVQVCAYVAGEVVEVLPGEGVVVETSGAYVQGIFGVGGEQWGPLRPVTEAPDEDLDPARIDASCRGQILVCGGLVGLEGVRRAQETGAVGVIGGGIRDQDLRALLGFDLGVAITGTEEIGLSLIDCSSEGRRALARSSGLQHDGDRLILTRDRGRLTPAIGVISDADKGDAP